MFYTNMYVWHIFFLASRQVCQLFIFGAQQACVPPLSVPPLLFSSSTSRCANLRCATCFFFVAPSKCATEGGVPANEGNCVVTIPLPLNPNPPLPPPLTITAPTKQLLSKRKKNDTSSTYVPKKHEWGETRRIGKPWEAKVKRKTPPPLICFFNFKTEGGTLAKSTT